MALTREQMRVYMAERRARIRQDMLALLGGVCVVCSSSEDLEFDHVDPAEKSFGLSGKGWDRPRNVVLAEVAKCQLLLPHAPRREDLPRPRLRAW